MPEPTLIPKTGDVRVWSASLDLPPERLRTLYRTLSRDEQARAGCYGTETLRDRFIARRGLLRAILSSELGCSPDRLRFNEPGFRKPELVPGEGSFSVSSSGDAAVFAFSRTREVGVDIERIDPTLPLPALIAGHFSPQEQGFLRGLTETERIAAFFRGWTGKEACAKALGAGLSVPLAQYDILAAEYPRVTTASGQFMLTFLPAPPSASGEAFCAALAIVTGEGAEGAPG